MWPVLAELLLLLLFAFFLLFLLFVLVFLPALLGCRWSRRGGHSTQQLKLGGNGSGMELPWPSLSRHDVDSFLEPDIQIWVLCFLCWTSMPKQYSMFASLSYCFILLQCSSSAWDSIASIQSTISMTWLCPSWHPHGPQNTAHCQPILRLLEASWKLTFHQIQGLRCDSDERGLHITERNCISSFSWPSVCSYSTSSTLHLVLHSCRVLQSPCVCFPTRYCSRLCAFACDTCTSSLCSFPARYECSQLTRAAASACFSPVLGFGNHQRMSRQALVGSWLWTKDKHMIHFTFRCIFFKKSLSTQTLRVISGFQIVSVSEVSQAKLE